MVRVAGLIGPGARRASTTPSPDGLTPAQQLAAIHAARGALIAARSRTAGATLRGAAARRRASRCCDAGRADRRPSATGSSSYFMEQIFPVLTPLAIDPAHPFPFIPNLGFCMVAEAGARGGRRHDARRCCRCRRRSTRFIRLPARGRAHPLRPAGGRDPPVPRPAVPRLRVAGRAGLFRVIRDSDVEIEEEAEDLVRVFETALKRRRRGRVIRLTVDAAMPRRPASTSSPRSSRPSRAGRLRRRRAARPVDLTQLIVDDRPDLLFTPYTPRFPERIRDFGGDCFAAIRAKDIVVHHPYESFDVVVQFLRQAARDPERGRDQADALPHHARQSRSCAR